MIDIEPQGEALNIVISTLEDNLSLFSTIRISSLPTDGGISCEISPGYNQDIFLNKKANKVIPLLFLCKNSNQIAVYDTLCKIGNYLQGLKEYPNGATFEWLNAEVSSEPSLVGKQENGQYIYSCIVDITIYF
ncbi:MAG: Bacteriophage minor capsid protein [Anaerocolumna sp.]|nr:Bacteriophage minor capsid protein [Anaerocolumna sp.]